jgi:hypothetical protein
MENLSKQLTNEALKRQNESLASIRKITTNEAGKLEWYLIQLLPASKKRHTFESVTELKSYLVDRLKNQTIKKIESLQKELVFNESLQEIESLTINVEWEKSKMWGNNPNASAYVPNVGEVCSGSIGGCGYDKESTSVAKVLNQVPQFRKLLFELKNKRSNCKKQNREVFGYGAGYGILPSFEGGVGVNCYDRVFNAIGYKFETVSSGKTFDVYRVSKVTPKEQKRKSTKLYSYSN